MTPELERLAAEARRDSNWKRWGPYLSERQWGTVREDYSDSGNCWTYFPHDQARSRAYRWGEDGLLGFCDRECRLCFALALWNEKDSILKERIYGLTGPEGNHGEDCKELYYYLDSTPTHSYMKALYKYPQLAFPYAELLNENRRRGKLDSEYELLDTGVFDDQRYFDVMAEYAKESPNDIVIRITISNRGPEAANIHVLPTLWFRNTWTWGCKHEGCTLKPRLRRQDRCTIAATHDTLGNMVWQLCPGPQGNFPDLLFTENESNNMLLFGSKNFGSHVKDAFHAYVVDGSQEAVNSQGWGTKAAAHYILTIPKGGEQVLHMRLCGENEAAQFSLGQVDRIMQARIQEANEYYRLLETDSGARQWGENARAVWRQAMAGLLWSKQFYHYVVKDWLDGDSSPPTPPPARRQIRNFDWPHLFNRDVISMPDKWEYPWYAAWDLAFHMIPFAKIDPDFAKHQLLLFLREWYMHPSGQIPAYEFNFSDVNPPVHAWACWRVYKMCGAKGQRDRRFLTRAFQKLMINFTWWVNRKDVNGKHLFAGGFLGLDNIGVFDRSKPLPTGGQLQQADGTAWMAFYCGTMLSIALELSKEDEAYEDIASKFFEHFVAITDAMNSLGDSGLWDEQDGFYYDEILIDGRANPLRVRSLVGIIPLIAVEVIEDDVIDQMPGFKKRMFWFLNNRTDLARHISYFDRLDDHAKGRRLLAIPSRERLVRVLRYLLDENEFLSDYGIRSVSRYHANHPYTFYHESDAYRVNYVPGESDSFLFGGNSNWRGPIWMPINYLIVEALERYYHFYGDSLKVECPTGSGVMMDLSQVALELSRRLTNIFLPAAHGGRPVHGGQSCYREDPHFKDLILFYEYFHGETGRGLGATHQTGWSALVASLIEKLARRSEPAYVLAEEADTAAAAR